MLNQTMITIVMLQLNLIIMYEELFDTAIEQIVILQAGEDGSAKAFVKNKADYEEKLGKAIKDFYKYYEEKTKDKVKS